MSDEKQTSEETPVAAEGSEEQQQLTGPATEGPSLPTEPRPSAPPPDEPIAPPAASQTPPPGYDWSQPPGPTMAHPGPARPPDAIDHLIPTKNPPALIGYYLGCFSVIPCLMPFLGPAAIVYGMKGLRAAKSNSNLPGAGHAVTAIALGALSTLVFVAAAIVMIVAAATGSK